MKQEKDGDNSPCLRRSNNARAKLTPCHGGCLLSPVSSPPKILTSPDAFEAVNKAFVEAGIPMASAEVTMIPQNYVEVTDPENVKLLTRILDLLDEDDDVQNVYTNWDD